MLLRIDTEKNLSIMKKEKGKQDNVLDYTINDVDGSYNAEQYSLMNIRVFIPSLFCGGDASRCEAYFCYKYFEQGKLPISETLFISGEPKADFYIGEILLDTKPICSNTLNCDGDIYVSIEINSPKGHTKTSTIKINIKPLSLNANTEEEKQIAKNNFMMIQEKLRRIDAEYDAHAKARGFGKSFNEAAKKDIKNRLHNMLIDAANKSYK